MFPHERSLVTRLQNKQFALIGVSNDDHRETSQKTVIDDHLPWRSFFDGDSGHIIRQWQVMVLPTVIIIDHKGIIRYKHVGSPEEAVLDGEVDQLVKEAETQESS